MQNKILWYIRQLLSKWKTQVMEINLTHGALYEINLACRVWNEFNLTYRIWYEIRLIIYDYIKLYRCTITITKI